MNVASPSSPNFGKHWTADEVHSMFAPSDETVRNVTEWLIASGIKEDKIVQSENNGWIAMNLPAQDAERLFQTEYHEHEHTDKGRLKVGCDEYASSKHLTTADLTHNLADTQYRSTCSLTLIMLLPASGYPAC